MRIKTIERLLPLDKIFKLMKQKFNGNYFIDENSDFSEFALQIIYINLKNNTLILRASIDKEYERTHFSVQAFKSKYLIKKFMLKKGSEGLEVSIAQKLSDLISKVGEDATSYPFTGLSLLKSNVKSINTVLIKTETFVLNKIIKILYDKYNLDDNLMKFPFSITQKDASWDVWLKIYATYITNIEKRWKDFDKNPRKIYKNYDFALENDYFQRIFDLIILEDKEGEFLSDFEISKNLSKKSNSSSKDEEELKITKISLFFIYTNRTMKPIRLMDLLKRMNEIKNFSKKFQDKINTYKIEISPTLILISSFGFSENIGDYLRHHIYRENEHTIPILTIPPIKNYTWHNLKDYSELNQSDTELKSQLEKIIRIGKKINSSSFFQKSRVQHAKSEYNELVEKINIAEKDNKFLQKLSWILNVDNLNESFRILDDKEQVKDLIINKDISKDNIIPDS